MVIAGDLNNLVDYYWKTFELEIKQETGAMNLSKFRDLLSQENASIGLIRDIAEAHKHLSLDRKTAVVTNPDQVKKRFVGFGEAFGLRYGGGEILALKLDDGVRYFDVLVEQVFDFWIGRIGLPKEGD